LGPYASKKGFLGNAYRVTRGRSQRGNKVSSSETEEAKEKGFGKAIAEQAGSAGERGGMKAERAT